MTIAGSVGRAAGDYSYRSEVSGYPHEVIKRAKEVSAAVLAVTVKVEPGENSPTLSNDSRPDA